MECTETPVLELAKEIPGTDALGEVQLPLPVEAEDVLEDPRRPIEEELARAQRERVA